MNFLNSQNSELIETYKEHLKRIASLSVLFSESDKPYLHYRAAENIFCKTFGAKNLSRGDIAFDAVKDNFAIGIKTFLLSGPAKMEKIAEFNSHSSELRKLMGEAKLKRLVELRNDRILFADRAYKTNTRLYHCIGREKGGLKIFETSYELVDFDSLKIINETESSFTFMDKFNEYNFNISKSTLFKKFVVPAEVIFVDVDILEDPMTLISQIYDTSASLNLAAESSALYKRVYSVPDLKVLKKFEDFVILPLYSPDNKKLKKEPIVPLKNQLNLWNSGGRKRNSGEVSIPIPAKVHKQKPGFFPSRDVSFSLELPSGDRLQAKVCSDGNKALMTNPNNALSDWLLRDVLKLQKGELLTYKKLLDLGIDSVKITKENSEQYRIEFAALNSYENFIVI